MSDPKSQQHEPSMEEILASIRRIIAEDGEAAPPANGAAPDAAAAAPAAGEHHDEILELTEVVEPDGSVVSLTGPAESEPPDGAAAAEAGHAAAPPRAEPVAPKATGEPLLSVATATASAAALSQIAALSVREDRRERDVLLGAGQLTLETIVREELRPILKEWLDRNLADLVERIVRDEVARLVRDVQRR